MKIEEFEEMIKNETDYLVATDVFLMGKWVRICDKTGDRVMQITRVCIETSTPKEIMTVIRENLDDI